MDVKNQIALLCRQVVEQFHPHKVILFGSYAYGTPTKDSDIDLMVVMPYTGKELDKMVQVRRTLDSSLPLDVLVKTPEQIRERTQLGDFFIAEILQKGKVLYEA